MKIDTEFLNWMKFNERSIIQFRLYVEMEISLDLN